MGHIWTFYIVKFLSSVAEVAEIHISLLFGCPQRVEAVILKSRNDEIQNLPSTFLANEGVDA